MTSHVHTISKEQFKANFIPHDPGRHRVDVKFNGEKVPNSPWFVEVKDPNTPLLAPMLVASRGSGGGRNGYDTVDNNNTYGSSGDLSTLQNNKLNSSYSSKLNSEMKQSSLFQSNKVETNNFSSSFNSSKVESNISSLKNGVDDLSISKKKQANSNSDFQKTDFGSYSLLETPKLLSGSKSSSSKTVQEERRLLSSSTEQLNSNNNGLKTTYSTTIERSINNGSGYSSLNKPHEARVKGLTNGSSTMPKQSTFNKSVERRSSLHAKVASDSSDQKLNGSSSNFSKSQDMLSSSTSTGYNATSSNLHQQHTISSSYKTQNSSQVTSSQSSSSHQRSTQETNNKALGSASPKLSSYKGTAEKCKFVGETVRHFNAGKPATFELFAPGAKKGDVDVNIISKSYLLHYCEISSLGNGLQCPVWVSIAQEL